MARFKSATYAGLNIAGGDKDPSVKFMGGRSDDLSDADAAFVRKFAKDHPEYGIEEVSDDEVEGQVAEDISADGALAQASSGDTIEEAQAQHPLLDTTLPPASVETPQGEQQVLAQTPAEVEAQALAVAAGTVNPAQGTGQSGDTTVGDTRQGDGPSGDLESLSLEELREKARQAGKPVSGNKAEVLARLREDADQA